MKIRPLNDRVIVVGIEEKKKTAGGISFRTRPRKNHKRGRS
jgi:co-chaperonin GroES (HSP10)